MGNFSWFGEWLAHLAVKGLGPVTAHRRFLCGGLSLVHIFPPAAFVLLEVTVSLLYGSFHLSKRDRCEEAEGRGAGDFWAEWDRICTLILPGEEAKRGAVVRGQRLRGVKPSPLKVTCQP